MPMLMKGCENSSATLPGPWLAHKTEELQRQT